MSFKHMSDEQLKDLASQGGKAAHAKGTAYKFTSKKAKEAAKKSAESRRRKASASRAEPEAE